MNELEGYIPTAPTLEGAASDPETVVLDSCNSTWHFEPARMRFRRTLKGLSIPGVTTGWRRYYGLLFDDDANGFVVVLNAQGTRLLRSWRHQPGADTCENCAEIGEQHTQEVSLDAIRQLVQ